MRFVGPKDECVAGYDFSHAICVTNAAFPGNDQIKLPLRGVCVVREIRFPWRHAIPFQIERLTLRQIERLGIAPQGFRNSFEGHSVFPAGRLPRLFFDLV
jgi:hypothetical protein